MEEVQSLLSTSEIVIAGRLYCYFNYGEGRDSYNFDKANWFYFDPNYLKEHRDETIDKLLEECMERDYMSKDEYTKRMYRCFLKDIKMVVMKKLKKELRD